MCKNYSLMIIVHLALHIHVCVHLTWETIVELDLWMLFSKIQLFSDGVRQEREIENNRCTFKFQCSFTSIFSRNQFETVHNEVLLIKMYFWDRYPKIQNPTKATKKQPATVTIPVGPLFKNSRKLGGLEVLPTTNKMGYLFYYFNWDLGLIYKQSQIASEGSEEGTKNRWPTQNSIKISHSSVVKVKFVTTHQKQ